MVKLALKKLTTDRGRTNNENFAVKEQKLDLGINQAINRH
jgi:hypothetical protein